MSTNLPNKSSSRAGRFKKKLVPQEALEKEAPVIQERMTQILELFNQQQLSAAEFTAIYILCVLSYRYPGAWLGAKRSEKLTKDNKLSFPLSGLNFPLEPNIQKRLQGFTTVGEVFEHFAFKSTPLTVNRSILNWSSGDYGLELMFRIPRPQEVLDQQKYARRCVTVVLEKERASKFILGERDALGFTMHDLIHADHFYHNNQSFQGQLGFYGFLDFCMSENHFEELLKIPGFEEEFEYLIADMNAYAIHLMKCFKSALTHYHLEGESFFSHWILKLNIAPNELEAFRSLNGPNYQDSQDEVLLNLLSRYQVERNRHFP
jgi:hypothetical protein